VKRIIIVAVLCGLALLALVPAASGAIRIKRVYFDSPGSDTGSNASLNREWVLIRNTGNRGRWLTGWRLRDEYGWVYRFGEFRLRAGRAVKIHSGNGTDGRRHLYWDRGGYVWNNTGDTAKLRTRGGRLVDRCSYDGTGNWVAC
jgi:Lamin Tail Domain